MSQFSSLSSAARHASTLPPMKDLTPQNITPNTHIINSLTSDPRLKFLTCHLITHIHTFIRETRPTTSEWLAAIDFLTLVGQTCTSNRQEFILLSDVLGISTLVNSINHPKPPGTTEGTVLGPFHTDDASTLPLGASIASDGKGEDMLVIATISNLNGEKIEGASVDVWQADQYGLYDTQYSGRDGPDCRGVLKSDKDGRVWFKGVKPVPYPIPHDGPVGGLVDRLNRHPYRPAHVHFWIRKEGYDELVTALYLRNDPFETSDAVFGLKSSLVFDLDKITDKKMADEYGMKVGDWVLKWDFVIVTEEEVKKIKDEQCRKSLEELGIKAKFNDAGLPIADDLD